MNLLEQIVAARRISVARARARARAAPQQCPGPLPGSRTLEAEDGLRQDAGLPTAGRTIEGSGAPRGEPDWVGFEDPGSPGVRDGEAGVQESRETSRDARVRSFEAALGSPGRRIIAEIKRRSPSAGAIREPLDPRVVAEIYELSGAAALSVLTEPDFFGGSDSDLVAARRAVALPVLRKDFILDAEQIAESRALGADAVLLLAAVLSREDLVRLATEARRLGMATLVEVHDEQELDAALASGTTIVGVNSRDLRDFSVDLGRAVRLARRIPEGLLRIAESGIHNLTDIHRLEDAGYRAFLVGESLLRSPDPGAALGELLA